MREPGSGKCWTVCADRGLICDTFGAEEGKIHGYPGHEEVEIGLIKLVQAQRYKGGVRITMLCGVRAFSDYVRKEAQAKEISRLLCAKENEIADAVSEKIGKSFMAIFIFVFVGMIIGTWMLSGTIPMLIYYGLKLLNPQLFLISAFVITVIVSVCTGTSFGSVGTVGLALIGVAQGLGVNLPAAAGAIISGAYFGDKMSPLSDTTNLAPVAAGTTLFEHIRHMFYTTVPAALVCLVVYFIAGRTGMVVSSVDASAANEMTEGLASIYHFNVFLLIPLVVVLVGSAMGKPTIPVMFTASVLAGVLAIVFQGATVAKVISAAYSGFSLSMLGIDPETVTGSIKTLVERGGMTSMMATVLKVLCAFLFAGAMSAAGFMNAILEKLKTFRTQ